MKAKQATKTQTGEINQLNEEGERKVYLTIVIIGHISWPLEYRW